MRGRTFGRLAAAILAASLAGCSNPLGRQYEYEEQLYLNVDGSATVIVDASIPALVALRGVPLDPSPNARLDEEQVRRLLEAGGCTVVRVGQPWRREGRRFIQVRLSTGDIRTLGSCHLLDWSAYVFEREGAGSIHFVQSVGPSSDGTVGAVNWSGHELVGFKLHAPSRIVYQNVRRLDDNEPGSVERGNILTWEQTLADRRAGKPLVMEVRMEGQSILHETLWLFGGALAAALVVLAGVVLFLLKRGRNRPPPVRPREP
jgi:hypothetical protein